LYHSFVQSLRTLFKNDTLSFFGFGLRDGSTCFSELSKSFPKLFADNALLTQPATTSLASLYLLDKPKFHLVK
jgi:hypothetical protein